MTVRVRFWVIGWVLMCVGWVGCAAAPLGLAGSMEAESRVPLTLAKESRAALARGAQFLVEKQGVDGSWLRSPAITALACMALHGCEAPELGITRSLAVEKGRRFLLQNVREDGAICPADRSYVNYSTSICLTALAVLQNPVDIEVMQRARRFLIGMQLDEDHPDHPTAKGNPFYGGIGYGSRGPEHPDLSNTQWALEALYLTEGLDRKPFEDDPRHAEESDLAWDKALDFLAAVQSISRTQSGTWVLKDGQDGGFFYQPDESKASKKHGDEAALRSYGSMTYAGLKSMIYADLEPEDPRVQAAVDWARRNYRLDENPGMGPEGHFYYLHTFAKAHSVYGKETIVTEDGREHVWRLDLIRALLGLQKGQGQWVNEGSGRWQESVPELVTCYAMISLETALADQVRAPTGR